MGVKRQARRRSGGAELSFDSLIDVFMNVLGVLMITAVVLALATPGQQSRPQPQAPSPPRSTPAEPEPDVPAVRLSLPQVQNASTRPLYLLITGDGIRPFSTDDLETVDRYFVSRDLGSSLELQPIPGRVMGEAELRSWLRQHDSGLRHVTAAITPEGIRYYRQVRTIAAEEGFRSGWLNHQGDSVILGSSGRTGSLVQ
ncbi:hypothetical protein KQ304_05995 [Synechococcus sp. CS-1329]|jgi:hypothetical protein|uniref:hypothetical protein n=1 Tax=Synechococcus sp. CS-1329 TaxID=2847975 RepID=UPI00223B7BCA|nr:hypothetical protein [Synechococcus sp. CS-1329]MCT0218555.1 hypothetical protein [Synechococcus sp. CS-1329]